MWRETTLLTDRAAQFAIAKIYAFSDSVPQLGGISTEPVKVWEKKINCNLETRYLKIWIGSTGIKWNSSGNFAKIHYIGKSRRVTENNAF